MHIREQANFTTFQKIKILMGKNDMICTLHYYSEGLTQKFDKDKFSRGTTLSYNITEFNGHHFYRAFLT